MARLGSLASLISSQPEFDSQSRNQFTNAISFNNMTTNYTAQNALANLVNYMLKREDAPASAEAHLSHCVFVLSEMARDWKLRDEEVVKTIKDSRDHMAYYFPDAKKDWPRSESE